MNDLQDKKIKWINSVLHNNEVATDEELTFYFIGAGLSITETDKIISQRNEALKDIHYQVKI